MGISSRPLPSPRNIAFIMQVALIYQHRGVNLPGGSVTGSGPYLTRLSYEMTGASGKKKKKKSVSLFHSREIPFENTDLVEIAGFTRRRCFREDEFMFRQDHKSILSLLCVRLIRETRRFMRYRESLGLILVVREFEKHTV